MILAACIESGWIFLGYVNIAVPLAVLHGPSALLLGHLCRSAAVTPGLLDVSVSMSPESQIGFLSLARRGLGSTVTEFAINNAESGAMWCELGLLSSLPFV